MKFDFTRIKNNSIYFCPTAKFSWQMSEPDKKKKKSVSIDPHKTFDRTRKRKMSLELCRLFDPAIELRKQWDLLLQIKAAIDRGEVEPVDLIIDRCFPAFVAMQNSDNPSFRRRVQDIFLFHLPQFYLGREPLNLNRFGQSNLFGNATPVSGGDDIERELTDADDDDEKTENLLSPFVGRKMVTHIATPQLQFESKLPFALANLIGRFHTNCDTLTEGGKLCGLGSGNGFTFPHPSPSGATAECQAECTNNLCVDWLTNLVTNWPTEILFEFDDAKNTPGTRPFYEGTWFVPVEELSLEIDPSYWAINVSPMEVVEFSLKQQAKNAIATGSGGSEVKTATGSSEDRKSSSNAQRPLSDFLRVGCRILNSGKSLLLFAELKLAPKDSSSQEMLELVTDKEIFVHTRFSKFTTPHTSHSDNAGASYFADSGTWRVVYLEKGKYALQNLLAINPPK